MQIFSEKKYRIIASEKEDYIVDLSLNKWNCLCGIQSWFFPVFGYVVSGEQVLFRKKGLNLVIEFILYIVMMFSLLMVSKALDMYPIFLTTVQKLIFCICLYIMSWLSKILFGKIAQKKFCFYNSKTPKNIVKLKIHFKTKKILFRLLFFNILGNFIIMGGMVAGIVFAPGTEAVLPFAAIPIYIFVSYSEMTKTPFLQKDIKNVEILEEKKC